jgi:hypothetical protein
LVSANPLRFQLSEAKPKSSISCFDDQNITSLPKGAALHAIDAIAKVQLMSYRNIYQAWAEASDISELGDSLVCGFVVLIVASPREPGCAD